MTLHSGGMKREGRCKLPASDPFHKVLVVVHSGPLAAVIILMEAVTSDEWQREVNEQDCGFATELHFYSVTFDVVGE